MLGYPPGADPPGADTPQEQISPGSRQTPPPEQTPPGADTLREQTPPGSKHPLEHTPLEQTPLQAEHAGRYGQCAGGTHPTGMHSCFVLNFTRETIHVIQVYTFVVKCEKNRNP